MTSNITLQILVYYAVLLALTRPMGAYMALVFTGEKTRLSPVFRPFEHCLYRLFGVREEENMEWTAYAFALLAFSLAGFLVTYGLLRLQGWFPLNPGGYGSREMPADLAFNTSVSFITNTNWQAYSPERTVSCFSNMVALAVQNWMSAAAGMAVAIALVRGIAAKGASGIGNFWVDVTRAVLYILLPVGLAGALVLVWQGVPQNFNGYTTVTTVEGAAQVIPQGPVASQEVIKELGTNGGGFFNANSSHPYENPTPVSNFIEMLLILLIPAGLTHTFGRMVGNTRQGWALFAAMSFLFLAGVFTVAQAEQRGNPVTGREGVQLFQTQGQSGGNLEGKEERFGIAASGLFATVTTGASCGAVNSMHDSYTPLGGLVLLANMLTGEVVFGGVGAGLYGMLMYAILAVFIAGLMVGRTPEYIGKKIEPYEVKMAMLAVLVTAGGILGFAAVAANLHLPKGAYWNPLGATFANVGNPGAHGFSEILYACTSAVANNGSAFAGFAANTPFYNLILGLGMLAGRFLVIIPLLAIAGSLSRKKYTPPGAGTFATDNATFAFLLVGVIIIVGALTFFPALSLGPLVEHFRLAGLESLIWM